MARLPEWIRCSLRTDNEYAHVQRMLNEMGLHTVCEDANCPNRVECWNSGTATMMIMGGVCTRNCAFCAVPGGRPETIETDEPARIAAAAVELDLRHLVLTSVTRDDLADGGAQVFADCIAAVKETLPEIAIEVLIPDLKGDTESIAKIMRAAPDVLNHNLETVRRLQPKIRPQASYECSLGVLRYASEWPGSIAVKSGLMVGLGERNEEIEEAIVDLYGAGCRFLTIGQYLAPSGEHWPVDRYVTPEQFERYAERARAVGFDGVASAPLVRSSYQAAEMMAKSRRELRDG